MQDATFPGIPTPQAHRVMDLQTTHPNLRLPTAPCVAPRVAFSSAMMGLLRLTLNRVTVLPYPDPDPEPNPSRHKTDQGGQRGRGRAIVQLPRGHVQRRRGAGHARPLLRGAEGALLADPPASPRIPTMAVIKQITMPPRWPHLCPVGQAEASGTEHWRILPRKSVRARTAR